MIKPDSGTVLLFGQYIKPASDLWNNVGYLVENPFSYPILAIIIF
jgi:ABC-2 type transport system ATP-binding protein